MRTPCRRWIAAPGLVVALLLAPAVPALAAEKVGGPRLQGTAVVTGSPSQPQPPVVSAASYVVADLDTGEVLAAKDPHGEYAPASTLKTLTALTLIPRLDPATLVTPTQADVDVDGSKVGLVPSMAYSVRDLLTALLVVSANDAAQALGTSAGGEAVTAGLMNAEAARLQALDTHAVNASGLDAVGQVSSAYDLALVARAAMQLPDFRSYVAVRRSTIPAPGGATIEIATHDRLLGSYEGALGIKNGFTEAARASFVGAATRGGHTLVVTLMRADPTVWKEAATLLDWGFAATAAGASPIGTLVPAAAPAAAPGAEPSPGASPALGGSAAAASPARGATAAAGGTSPLVWVLVVLALVAVLVVRRRRAVVRARAARRLRARAQALADRPHAPRDRARAPRDPARAPRDRAHARG